MKNLFFLTGIMLSAVSSFCQDTIVMPVTGNGGIYNTCYALITDNGNDSNYVNNSDSRITIFTFWTQNVSIYFEEFETELFFDSLTLYDGPGITDPVIGTYSGTGLQGQTVSSTGTSITLRFKSDDIQAYKGFKAWVTCLAGSEPLGPPKDLIVYPNPGTGIYKLSGIENIIEPELRDITGRKYLISYTNHELNISQLPNGIYFLTVLLADKSLLTQKLIKSE